MRKTGLCGVVIATLFGTAGLLQHPSHQDHTQTKKTISSPLAQAGVNLLNSYSQQASRKAGGTATFLPEGFLKVFLHPGPAPSQIAAARRAEAARHAQLEAAAAAQQAAAQRAEAEAAAQAQAQALAQQRAAAAAQAAAAQAAAAQAQQAQQAQQSAASAGGVWAELRDCESGGDYAEDSGNGYYGAYQFALSTWEGLGFSGLPSDAPPAVQDEAARELQARSGWGQWPACAAELGLI